MASNWHRYEPNFIHLVHEMTAIELKVTHKYPRFSSGICQSNHPPSKQETIYYLKSFLV